MDDRNNKRNYNSKEWFCNGKEAFETHALAARVSNRMRRRHKTPKVPYLCSQCGKYHIGTPKKRRNKKRDHI